MRNLIITSALVVGLSTGLVACKSQADKDKELKAKIEAVAPGVTVSVNNGVATLTGQVNDAQAKQTLEESVKKVDGVKSVTNQLEVPPPPVINNDAELNAKMSDILKEFPKVKAAIVNSEITLTGDVTKEELPKVIQKVQELKPKKVVNNLVVK